MLREPVDLSACGPEVPGQSKHAYQEPPAGDVVLVAREVALQQANGVSLAVLASERGRALKRGRRTRRAPQGRRENQGSQESQVVTSVARAPRVTKGKSESSVRFSRWW